MLAPISFSLLAASNQRGWFPRKHTRGILPAADLDELLDIGDFTRHGGGNWGETDRDGGQKIEMGSKR